MEWTPNDTCSHVDTATENVFRYSTICFAGTILIVLSFTVPRSNFLKNFLWGVPGIMAPLNFLGNNPHRYIAMLVFAIMSGDILKFFFHHSHFVIKVTPEASNCYVKVLYEMSSLLLLISYLSIKYFPLLACLGVVIPVLDPAIGLLYSITLFSSSTYSDVLRYCHLSGLIEKPQIPAEYAKLLAIYIAVQVPIYVSMVIVFLWFLTDLFSSLKALCIKGYRNTWLHKEREVAGDGYYSSCVRNLLKRRLQTARGGTVASSLFPFWLSPRRLPLKFISAMIVTLFMIYQFGLLFFGLFLYAFLWGVSLLKDLKEEIAEEILEPLLSPEFGIGVGGKMYAVLMEVVEGLSVVIPASPLAAMLLSFILLFHLYITVHNDVTRMAQGKHQYLKLMPTLKLSYSWHYPGYQIAFAFTAFVIYTFSFGILGCGGMLVYFAFKFFPDFSRCVLFYIVIPIVWVLGVMLLQILMAKVLFIEESRGKFMALTNQRLLHWVSYFLFIYDAINGLLSAVLRAVLTQVIGLLLMIRLDRVVLMKGFECFDIGHKAYVGFLQLNHAYDNPVVHTFVRLLLESSFHSHHAPLSATRLLDHSANDFKDYGAMEKGVMGRRRGRGWIEKQMVIGPTRARKRWLVAYTLLRNPSLSPLTSSLLRNPLSAATEMRASSNPQGRD